jgi:hypothetical protein
MRRIPVDTTRVRFVGTGKSAARAQYAVLADGSRKRALLTFLWVGFHDRPSSAGQRPPRVRSATAISASGLW